jgi:hypothetical protein
MLGMRGVGQKTPCPDAVCASRLKTSRPTTNLTLICGLSFRAWFGTKIGLLGVCLFNGRILLANSNQRYFNRLVKKPCHKTPYRCPHRLRLSFQSSRSCAWPNIKALKDKGLEFANSICPFPPDRYWWEISPFFSATLCIRRRANEGCRKMAAPMPRRSSSGWR